MIRGTTPTHIFTLPFDAGQISQLRLTYSQDGTTVFEKNETEVTKAGTQLEYTLTQTESLAFTEQKSVEIQLKIKTIDGAVVASKIMRTNASTVLNEEVLYLSARMTGASRNMRQARSGATPRALGR